MNARGFALVAMTALALAGCNKKSGDSASLAPSSPVAAVAPPAGKAWTDVVADTPQGGVVIGNPNAPVKFVEYASFTCPHCKKFEDEGAQALLSNYVASGKVSWEFRSFLIHGADAPVTLLMKCRGPAPFFKLSQQLYAAQNEWLMKLVNLPPAQLEQIQKLAPVDQFKPMTEAMGLYGFMAARGLPKAQAEACLTDKTAIDAMTARQNTYQNNDQINSTPSFFINGQQQTDVSEWSGIEARLKAAIG